MGRKDATQTGKPGFGQKGAPVDNYRKQIGKHDYKKSKKDMKSAKNRSDLNKSATPVKDTVLVLMTGLLLVVGLYFVLYWYLNKDIS